MAFEVCCTRSARNQLATIHLKYRGAVAARAEAKIVDALEQNPSGGRPLPGGFWTVIVLPLRATYKIEGDKVTIVQYDDARSP